MIFLALRIRLLRSVTPPEVRMTDEQDDQSSSQDAQDASQKTSNQGTSISFDVRGDVPAISQPKSMACWATVTTMNMSWKDQQSYSIEAATDSLGSDFQIFLQPKLNFPKE